MIEYSAHSIFVPHLRAVIARFPSGCIVSFSVNGHVLVYIQTTTARRRKRRCKRGLENSDFSNRQGQTTGRLKALVAKGLQILLGAHKPRALESHEEIRCARAMLRIRARRIRLPPADDVGQLLSQMLLRSKVIKSMRRGAYLLAKQRVRLRMCRIRTSFATVPSCYRTMSSVMSFFFTMGDNMTT